MDAQIKILLKSDIFAQNGFIFFSLKIKTAVNEDEYYEKLRLKWQKEHSANLLKDTVRYQDIQFDGILKIAKKF